MYFQGCRSIFKQKSSQLSSNCQIFIPFSSKILRKTRRIVCYSQSFLNSHNLNPKIRILILGFGWVKSFENFQKNGPYFSSKMKNFHFQKRWKPDDLKSNFRENSSPKCNCSEESFDCSFPFLQKLDFGEQPFWKKKTKKSTQKQREF